MLQLGSHLLCGAAIGEALHRTAFAQVDLLMEAQVQGTLGLADKITNKRLLRIDAIARPGRFTLDNSNEISELKALGENSARQFAGAAAQRFFHDPIQPFTPYFDPLVAHQQEMARL